MGTYNVSKIEGWLKDFTSAKDKFTNTYYGDFKKSYIRSCNDSVVVKMRNKLDEHYARISRINSRVKNVWDDFLWDLKTIDNRLAGGKGSTNNSSIGSKLAKLPSLKEYKANLNVRINSISAAVGTVNALGWADDKSFLENLANSSEILNSTAAVTATSVISGVFKLGEKLVDGVVWLGTAAVTGVATHIGFEEWANDKQNGVMNFIAVDAVGKANEILYKNTSIGRNYNDKSLIKYDSNIAQSIQNTTTKVTEFAVATGLTVATGGMAAPLSALIVAGTGFVIGAGDKAEEDFSKEDRSFWGDSKEIAIAGGIKAIEFYSEGQMGAGMIKAAGSIISSGGVKNLIGGIKTVLSNGESSLFTKESLKNGLKATFKDVDTYMDSIGAAFNNISYNNKDGVQVNWKGLAKETACNFAMNSVFGFIGNAFETKMTTGMKNTIEGVNPKNAEVSSKYAKPKSEANLDSLKREYDELLKKSKESWFVKAKEAGDNHWAWDLNEVDEVDKVIKRMKELEGTLGIKETEISKSKIYDYSGAKKEADELARRISKESIPGFENIDTNSLEYKKAIQDMYSKPSPSGKQDLSQIENPFYKNGNLDLNKTYSENLSKFSKEGISYEQYATQNGINIKNYGSEMDLAFDVGDENWYLVQVIKNNVNKENWPAAIKKPRSELNTNELINAAGPFLKQKDIINLNEIEKRLNMKNLSLQNQNTLSQFQRAGGCEINGMLRGKNHEDIHSLYDLELIMNRSYGGANQKHPRQVNKNYSIVDEIDDIIKNNCNTSTIKGVSYLTSVGSNVPTKRVLDTIDSFGPNSPEALQAVQDLIGLDITDPAYNSKTIPPTRNTYYSNKFYNKVRGDIESLDIKVESYISPGCGAYIDTYGGIENGLGEMLIKRNCNQKIVDAYIDPNTSKLVLVTLYT